jgi:hypothetical protein
MAFRDASFGGSPSAFLQAAFGFMFLERGLERRDFGVLWSAKTSSGNHDSGNQWVTC